MQLITLSGKTVTKWCNLQQVALLIAVHVEALLSEPSQLTVSMSNVNDLLCKALHTERIPLMLLLTPAFLRCAATNVCHPICALCPWEHRQGVTVRLNDLSAKWSSLLQAAACQPAVPIICWERQGGKPLPKKRLSWKHFVQLQLSTVIMSLCHEQLCLISCVFIYQENGKLEGLENVLPAAIGELQLLQDWSSTAVLCFSNQNLLIF